MKTIAVYLRSGVRYQRIVRGQFTAAQIQRQLLDAKIGCQKVLSVQHVQG